MAKWIFFALSLLVFWGCSPQNDKNDSIPALPAVHEKPDLPLIDSAASTVAATPVPIQVDKSVCERICQHGLALHCGTIKTCLEGCLGMLAIEVCTEQMRAFLRCAASRPVTSFECDEQTGAPALKENECAGEQMAVGFCMNQL